MTLCPVIVLTWSRPDHLRHLLAQLQQYALPSIYFSVDGYPTQRPNIHPSIDLVRHLIANYSHPTAVIHINLLDKHYGCSLGVEQGLNWFFSHEDSGCILEDDCIPGPDFFTFCSKLLSRYRSNSRVWSVSGTSFYSQTPDYPYAYYFSHYQHSWGWATWSDRWIRYSRDISYLDHLTTSQLSAIFPMLTERLYWLTLFRKLKHGTPDSWAYRWNLASFVSGGLSIMPVANLIHNIGFDSFATNTSKNRPSLRCSPLPDLTHPPHVIRDYFADRQTFRQQYCSLRRRILIHLDYFFSRLS